MQKTDFRHLFHIHRAKIALVAALCLWSVRGQAQQWNLPQYDNPNRIAHFGFTLAANTANFRVNTIDDFLRIDTLKSIRTQTYPGFGIGGIANFHLHDQWDIRILAPSITFAQRDLIYTFDSGLVRTVPVETVSLDASLLVKYKSIRHGNARIYIIAGFRYGYDFSSQIDVPRSEFDPIVALQPTRYGFEIGFGFDMYYTFFKFSPEVRLFTGLHNAMVRDNFVYTKAIQSIYPQLITFSLHFE